MEKEGRWEGEVRGNLTDSTSSLGKHTSSKPSSFLPFARLSFCWASPLPSFPLHDHNQDVFLASKEGNRDSFLDSTSEGRLIPLGEQLLHIGGGAGRSLLTHTQKEGQGLQGKGRVQLKKEWGLASGEQEMARQRVLHS